MRRLRTRSQCCRWWRGAALVAAALAIGSRAPAQILDLSPPPAPPPLAVHPATATLAAVDLELERLTIARRAATGIEVELVDGLIALRRVTRALLVSGIALADQPEVHSASGRGFGASERLAQGWRLHEARAEIAAALRRAITLGEGDPRRDRVRALLRDSAEAQPLDLSADGPAPATRMLVADALAPLACAAFLASDQPLPSIWPTTRHGGPWLPPATEADRSLRERAGGLAEQVDRLLDSHPLPATVAAARAALFDRRRVAAALALDAALTEATWLERRDQESLRGKVLDSLRPQGTSPDRDIPVNGPNAADPPGPGAGPAPAADLDQRDLEASDLEATASILRQMTLLRPMLAGSFRQLQPVVAALRTLGGPATAANPNLLPNSPPHSPPHSPPVAAPGPPPDLARGVATKQLILGSLQRMAESREIEGRVRGADLAEARQKLSLEYRETETALLLSLERIVASPSPRTDPGIASLVGAHTQLVGDLRRVARLDDWSASVAAAAPTLTAAVRGQLIKMIRWLIDPNRRPEAVQAIAQLDQQFSHFAAMPAEARLRQGSLAARFGAEPTQAMLRSIESGRAAWVEAWSRGDGGSDASRELLAWTRLLRAIDAVDAMLDPTTRDRIHARLVRFAAWSIPTAAVTAVAEEAIGPIRMLLERARPPTEVELRRLETITALPRLCVALDARLIPLDELLPSAAWAALGSALERPPADVWPRGRLGEFARLAVQSRAWHEGVDADEEPRAARRAHVDASADLLLRELGEWRGPIPTLRGWDGSDPEAGR